MPDIEEEFIRDCWYVAGWSGDFTHALTPLRILDEPIVVFRTEAGVPAALEDAGFAAIHRAHLDHQVLVFRGLSLTPRQQIGFS